MTTKGLTFWLDNGKIVNVEVTLKELKNGDIQLVAVYGSLQIGNLITPPK